MTEICMFKGEHRFLSNFHPCSIELMGVTYPSVEHFYQAMKSHDQKFRFRVAAVATPARAKWMGRNLKNIRSDWSVVRDDIMAWAVRQKFSLSKNPELAANLIATGEVYLREGNNWGDYYWGCVPQSDGTWQGQNKLGALLMQVRFEIQQK